MILIWALYLHYQSTTGRGGAKTPRNKKKPLGWGFFTDEFIEVWSTFAGIIKSRHNDQPAAGSSRKW